MTDELLKQFILYTQALETTYHEWKNYWFNYYMNQGKDLYDPYDFNRVWLKNHETKENTRT